MVEVHPRPDNALCDGAQSLTPAQFASLVQDLKPLVQACQLEEPTSPIPALNPEPKVELEILPSFDQFRTLLQQGKAVPVYAEVMADTETPVSALQKIGQQGYSFLLESVTGGEQAARYSFLSNDIFQVFRSRGRTVEIEIPDEKGRSGHLLRRENADPLAELQKMLDEYQSLNLPELPRFSGGAVGFLGYEAIKLWEKVPSPPAGVDTPDILMMFTRTLLAFDHVRRAIKIIVNVLPDQQKTPEEMYRDAVQSISRINSRLKKTLPPPPSLLLPGNPGEPGTPVESNFTQPAFMEAVQQAKEYIRQGDIFQVVLSQRFTSRGKYDPLSLYRVLRSINPSPYMFYLNLGGVQAVGASPEMFVRLEGDQVQLRPIAGTRKRGLTPEEDEKLAADLLQDEKERAEHVMLVDLGRNDLGRVCLPGTVKVKEFLGIENYSHVMHLVSSVEGRLKPQETPLSVLKATFPAGTVSGAPKIRAMEIIAEMEPVQRGLYSGVVGYISFTGNMDTCITIRTVVIDHEGAHVQAGAGIVADSVPEREYEETLNKARGMLAALDRLKAPGSHKEATA
jgi:anthranilate synthase component 1